MLAIEEELVDYIYETRYEGLLSELIGIGKKLILTILGTTIAGAGTEGCETLVHQVEEWGRKEEATIWLHGSKVPAHNTVRVLCKACCSMKESWRPLLTLGVSFSSFTLIGKGGP